MNKLKKVFAWTIGIAMLGLVTTAANAQKAPAEQKTVEAKIGKPAPDFTLKDTEGKEHTLKNLRGKIVILEWTNHTCPFIKHHEGKAKTMQHTCEAFKDKDVVWLGIDSSQFAPDQVDQIRDWIKTNKLPYPILLDPSGKVGKTYGAKTTPHMFVIDKKGILAYAGAIDNANPLASRKKPTHNYVAEAVTALLEGSTVAVKTTKPYGCSVKYGK